MRLPDELALSTARMSLRPIQADDVDALVALDADSEVMRYINGGAPNSREAYLNELLPRMLAWPEQPFGFFAAIARAPESMPDDPLGEFLGWFHLRPSVADAAILELGYRLRRSVWGQGLASEGSRALLGFAFGQLEQQAVDACADPRNAASIAVMRKVGMQPAGSFVHPRAGIEVVRYLLRRQDFAG